MAAAADSGGSVYGAGTTYGALPGQSSAGSQDAFVRKYDANGTEMWTRQFGQQGQDYATGVALDTGGNAYVSSKVATNAVDTIEVRKYSASGSLEWTQTLVPAAFGTLVAIAADAAGNVYVGSAVAGALPGQSHAGLADAFVRKYSTNGTELWTRQFGTSDDDLVSALIVDAAGSVYAVGDTLGVFPGQSDVPDRDGFVRKYDALGTEICTRQFGNRRFGKPLPELVHAAALYRNESLYVVGDTVGATGSELDGFLIKLALSGSPALADINRDGKVDCQDFNIVRTAFGTRPDQPRWDERAYTDFDDQVDVRDLAFVSQRLPAGTRCQ